MRSRRFLFVVVLGALVAGALAAGRAASPTPPAPHATVAPNVAVVAQSNTVWFCPGLPTALPRGSARVTFANIGAAAADAVVTDLVDKGKGTHLTIRIPAYAVVTRTRDQLGGPGALTIETFGGRVLVEEGIEGVRALESTACATQTSKHWYFAAGATPRGVQQWIVIDNPYASDAKVDVTIRTNSGLLRPDALQGLDIAPRSRWIVPIHEVAVRKDRVAVEVDAALGSVVVAQTLVYTAAAGTQGVALSMGAPAASTDWTFAGAPVQAGSTALVAIANVGGDDAQVEVQVATESPKTTIAPTGVTVAQDAVVWVVLGSCTAASGRACVAVPSGARYSVDVRSDQNVSIVAQTLTRYAGGSAVVGAVTSPGGAAPARAWAFARSRVRGERSSAVSLFNPGADPAVVDLGLVRGGAVDRPRALQRVNVPPGRAVTVIVVGGRKPANNDAALTIDANVPIFAQRSIVAADEAATSVGVVAG